MWKISWIFLKIIFSFQYVNRRITFVNILFHLLQIWNTLFSKNMFKIVWLRRSSKSNILKNYITIMLSLVIIYKTSVGQQKIQKLETRYCAALMKLNFPSCLPCWSPSRRWSGDKLRPRIRGQKDVKRNTFIPGKIIITDLD